MILIERQLQTTAIWLGLDFQILQRPFAAVYATSSVLVRFFAVYLRPLTMAPHGYYEDKSVGEQGSKITDEITFLLEPSPLRLHKMSERKGYWTLNMHTTTPKYYISLLWRQVFCMPFIIRNNKYLLLFSLCVVELYVL